MVRRPTKPRADLGVRHRPPRGGGSEAQSLRGAQGLGVGGGAVRGPGLWEQPLWQPQQALVSPQGAAPPLLTAFPERPWLGLAFPRDRSRVGTLQGDLGLPWPGGAWHPRAASPFASRGGRASFSLARPRSWTFCPNPSAASVLSGSRASQSPCLLASAGPHEAPAGTLCSLCRRPFRGDQGERAPWPCQRPHGTPGIIRPGGAGVFSPPLVRAGPGSLGPSTAMPHFNGEARSDLPGPQRSRLGMGPVLPPSQGRVWVEPDRCPG